MKIYTWDLVFHVKIVRPLDESGFYIIDHTYNPESINIQSYTKNHFCDLTNGHTYDVQSIGEIFVSTYLNTVNNYQEHYHLHKLEKGCVHDTIRCCQLNNW